MTGLPSAGCFIDKTAPSPSSFLSLRLPPINQAIKTMFPPRILALCLLPLALAAPTPHDGSLAPLSVEGEVVGDGYIVVLKDEAVSGGLRAFEEHLGEVEGWSGVYVSLVLLVDWDCGSRSGDRRCLGVGLIFGVALS